MAQPWTRIQLEEKLAQKIGCTPDELGDHGFIVIPCDCGEATCHEWRITMTNEVD